MTPPPAAVTGVKAWCLAMQPRDPAGGRLRRLPGGRRRVAGHGHRPGIHRRCDRIQQGTRLEYALLILLACAFPAAMLAGGAASPFILLPLLTLPPGGRCIWSIYRETGHALNVRLGATAMLSLWFSLLLAIGMAMS